MSSIISKEHLIELAVGLCFVPEDLEIVCLLTGYHYHRNQYPGTVESSISVEKRLFDLLVGQYLVLVREAPKIRIVPTGYRYCWSQCPLQASKLLLPGAAEA